MICKLLCFFLVVMALDAFAQADSLTISDTIGTATQTRGRQNGYGFSYYGANHLAASQLYPILKGSPDSLTRKLFRQSRRLSLVSTGMVVSSLGLLLGSISTVGRQSRVNGALLIGGYAALFGSFIPHSISNRQLGQAIGAHNANIKNRPQEYLPPIIYTSTQPWTLSINDTIARYRVGLTQQYRYRGIPVYPGVQLARLTNSLNDHEVNDGIRYVRTIGRIGGVIGGLGQGLLTGYVTSLLLTRRYRRNASINSELLTTGLLCVGANFVLRRHANRVERRWIVRYNDLLKDQFQAH